MKKLLSSMTLVALGLCGLPAQATDAVINSGTQASFRAAEFDPNSYFSFYFGPSFVAMYGYDSGTGQSFACSVYPSNAFYAHVKELALAYVVASTEPSLSQYELTGYAAKDASGSCASFYLYQN